MQPPLVTFIIRTWVHNSSEISYWLGGMITGGVAPQVSELFDGGKTVRTYDATVKQWFSAYKTWGHMIEGGVRTLHYDTQVVLCLFPFEPACNARTIATIITTKGSARFTFEFGRMCRARMRFSCCLLLCCTSSVATSRANVNGRSVPTTLCQH